MFARVRRLLLTTTALVPLGILPAAANPLGAQVVGGSATVQGQGTASVTVTQTTDKAIVNWNTFNIGAHEKTQFIQPGASSVTLNRVTGGLGPSQIFGSLSANGRVFVVNPDGILIGPGAKIDTAGFLATTHDIANADFMAGHYNFSIPGRPDASVVNQGTITAQSGGFAALVAPGVRNSGTITARLGKVALAAGNGFSLDFYGDKLITLGVSDSVAANVKDAATGRSLKSLVSNEGKLKANGGLVQLTAVTARRIVDSVINTKGVIEANSIGRHNGMIVLGGPTAKTKIAGAPAQTVAVSGKLSARGKRQGTTGGTIEVTGENIELAGANINASGRDGGGTVLIGGDTGGGHPSIAAAAIAKAAPETRVVETATTVSVDAASTVDASAKDTGDGGKVVVWSDGSTKFDGAIAARGGTQSGDGGFIETSGKKQLGYTGAVDTGAPNGKSGTLLLDPQDVTIGTSGAWVITPSALQTALASGDVIVTTSSGSGNGDITVAENVDWSNASALTLNAFRNIAVNANITNTDGAAVTLRSDNTGTGAGTVTFGSGNKVSTSGAIAILYNPTVNPAGSAVNSTSYVSPTENYSSNFGFGGTLTAFMLVNSINDLQNIQNNLSGTYALGKNIDASSTSTNPNIIAFTHIGSSSNPFVGIFDGNGLTIDKLYVNQGLFGEVGTAGTVRNVGITNGSAIAIYGVDSAVGLLVGKNNGTVINSFAEGSVNANTGGATGGGLVGWNKGTVFNSFAAVSVKGATGNGPDGGLVGYNDTTGTITQSYATGNVSGLVNFRPAVVGGLVGSNSGTISNSYATGDVTGTFQGHVGGFVAINYGTIDKSYATGSVKGGYLDTDGGFVGYNDGRISNSYASGSTTEVTFNYAYLGGFVGYNDGGTYTNDFWDTQTSGVSTASRNTALPSGATGLTTSQARQQGSYSNWDFSNDWFAVDGFTRPFLRSEWSTTITNAHQLQLMAMNLSNTYKLGSDIDLGPALAANGIGNFAGMWGSTGFAPVGTRSNSTDTNFSGIFDGTGHIIDHLTITNLASTTAGLFGAITSPALVENVGLTNASIVGGQDYTGGLVGYNNRATISQSYVTGTVGASSGVVGGLVGINYGTIAKSYSSASVSGDGQAIGGLVGYNANGAGVISQSYATGAAVGFGTYDAVGGLVGTNNAADIIESYSTGNVQLNIGGVSGGLVGVYNRNLDSSNISYWDIQSSGQTQGAGAGTPANPAEISGLDTTTLKAGIPTGFDPTVWAADVNANVNTGYPYLRWQTAGATSFSNVTSLTGELPPATTPSTASSNNTDPTSENVENFLEKYLTPPNNLTLPFVTTSANSTPQTLIPNTSSPPTTLASTTSLSPQPGDITGSIAPTTLASLGIQNQTSDWATTQGSQAIAPISVKVGEKSLTIAIQQEAPNNSGPYYLDCIGTVYAMIGSLIATKNSGKPTTYFAANYGIYIDQKTGYIATTAGSGGAPAINLNTNSPLTDTSKITSSTPLGLPNEKVFGQNPLQNLSPSSLPVVLGGTVTSQTTGHTLPHFMLAVAVSPDTRIITALDPLTGAQVQIDSAGNALSQTGSISSFHASGFVGIKL